MNTSKTRTLAIACLSLLLTYLLGACDSASTPVLPTSTAVAAATLAPSTTPLPPTATVPPPTSAATQTSTPPATTSATATDTQVPPTLTNTAPPPATSTPTRPPLPTATRPPVSQASQAICPAWFNKPEPNKGLLVIEAWWGVNIEIRAPYRAKLARLDPTDTEPGRRLLTLEPGRYEIVYDGDLTATTNFDIQAGQTLGNIITMERASQRFGPTILKQLHADTAAYPPPQGCPGAPPPTIPPAALCPRWYAALEPAGTILVLLNQTTTIVSVVGVNGTDQSVNIDRKAGEEPGRQVLHLNPGHYEFDTTDGTKGGHITADLSAGQRLLAEVALVKKDSFGSVTASPLAIPAGCAGSVPTNTPAPAAQSCPAWYVAPPAGMGMLVIEDYVGSAAFSKRNLEVVGLPGVSETTGISAGPNGEPGRLVVMLKPGHYSFDTRFPYGSATFDLAAEQQLVIPLGVAYVSKWPVYQLNPPPGC